MKLSRFSVLPFPFFLVFLIQACAPEVFLIPPTDAQLHIPFQMLFDTKDFFFKAPMRHYTWK
jgi:hypothetical protein